MAKKSGKRAMPLRPRGGGSSPKDQIQQLQADFARMQEELKSKTTTVSVGGGVVEVVVSGDQEVKELKIAPEVVDPEDVEMLEDLILAAVNEALTKSREMMASQLGGITGGLAGDLGLGDLF